ncbi:MULTISPECIES: polymorphic outer membrane protein middle domain-containing protein [Chlamydia]|uniref:Autotransporter domain-containing protein n=1 Tax=Chlamydophila parapsittaci TaxID=344886 RepID=A0ABX5W031_9CHLA|nr:MULTISPECIES: polymorphic outer membrane protein middle domain-containing protein [Chlamydia]AFS20396.1 outer membrane autotransporter barrel domain protein [Chlamydia psittaci GR9]QDE37471.1 autotransporter domain-containing protein [Chlamydophila parapsittaci]QHE19131.1 autotransporter domain-containing protein [Chlamydia psittaci]UOB75983.1 autotransporter domain-containing protein [Chlamydia psittaci]USB81400.1 autotransporter domain-containing protein [Chlamydia psittaci]
MKASFRKFLVSTTLTLPCSFQAFSLEIVVPNGTYDGYLREMFPYTITSNLEGTTAILSGDLNILNLDNSMAATPSSCFFNSAGSMTIVGKGHNLTFTNLRTSVNGAALSSIPTSTPESFSYTITGIKTFSCSNCAVLIGRTNSSTVTTPKGGAVYSKSPIFFKDIQNVLFKNNRAGNNGGALWGQVVDISNVTKSLQFLSNVGANGGAIGASTSLNVTRCPSILFRSNSAEKLGGAIHSVNPQTPPPPAENGVINTVVNFSNNGSVQFDANNAKSGGGIYSKGNINFSNNAQLIMQNNSASPEIGDSGEVLGQGGAIYCTQATAATKKEKEEKEKSKSEAAPIEFTGLTITNQHDIFFANNFAANAGGAIYGEKVSITSSGKTVFTNNTAKTGGAIYIAAGGDLSLSADYGNMIFYDNLNTNDGSLKRNAITLDKGATIKLLAASGDHKLCFYDPIVTTLPETAPNGTNTLTINPDRGDSAPFTNYIGTVLFSGAHTNSTEDTPNASTIYQKVVLGGGKLVLADKASLSVVSFDQESDSILLMDSGTSLSTTTNSHATPASVEAGAAAAAARVMATAEASSATSTTTTTASATNQPNTDGSISIKDLHINLGSLTQAGEGAKIDVKGSNGTIKITGHISLDDVSGNAYENHDLFNQNTVTLKLLSLSTAGDSKITNNDLQLTPRGDADPQYGYQGSWKLSWEDGTNGDANKKKVLKATWTKTGFIPSPERQASLVPNSLWGAFIDLRSMNALATASCDGFGYSKGLWVAGISNVFHHDRNSVSHGFRRISGGYVIGANSQTLSDSVFGVAFSQVFGKSKDYVVSTTKSQALVGSAYLSIKRPLSNTIFTTFAARINYSHTNEDMKTRYTFIPEESGNWDNNCWLGEVGGSLPIVLNTGKLHLNQFVPFVNVQIGYAEHGSFREQLAEARSFCSSRLINLAIPCGFKIDRRSHSYPDFYSLAVSYVPDVWRRNPGCTTLLLANGARWKTLATNLDRQGLLIEGSTHTAVNNNIEIFSHGSCELRKSSRNYNINVGSKFRF